MKTKYYAAIDKEGNELCVVSGDTVKGATANLKYAMFSGITDKVIEVDSFRILDRNNKTVCVVSSINKEIALQKAKSRIFKNFPFRAEKIEKGK